MNHCETSTCQARCTLIFKAGICGKVDYNMFYKNSKGRKSKSRDTNSIIKSILNFGFHIPNL